MTIRRTLFGLVALAAIVVSLAGCGQKEKKTEEANTEPVIVVNHDPDKTYIYSNSYDGYLNVRERATVKSRVLGKFPNGPQGAELVRYEGNWVKVAVDGVVGFVSKAYTQNTPTAPVFNDANYVIGAWSAAEDNKDDLLIFDNGTFAFWNGDTKPAGPAGVGRWYLEGYNIILRQSYDMFFGEYARKEMRWNIDAKAETMDNRYKKLTLITDTKAEREGYGGNTVRWAPSQLEQVQNRISSYAKR